MFLQITTLVVLAITLATRFATAKSSQGMQLEITELGNDYSKLRTDYNKLFESRKASEEQAKKLEAEIADLKESLEEAKGDLDDQIDLNEDLNT